MAQSITAAEAQERMLGAVQTMLSALDLPTLGFDIGSTLTVVYDDQQESVTPPDDVTAGPWLRVALNHLSGTQRAMGDDGVALYESKGTLTISCYTARGRGLGNGAYTLGEALLTLFRNRPPNAVRYTNPSLRDAGPSGPWTLTLVRVEFAYDTHT